MLTITGTKRKEETQKSRFNRHLLLHDRSKYHRLLSLRLRARQFLYSYLTNLSHCPEQRGGAREKDKGLWARTRKDIQGQGGSAAISLGVSPRTDYYWLCPRRRRLRWRSNQLCLLCRPRWWLGLAFEVKAAVCGHENSAIVNISLLPSFPLPRGGKMRRLLANRWQRRRRRPSACSSL